jgi:hypothetical protein
MKDLEKKMQEASEKYAKSISLETEDTEIDDEFHAEDFVKGALSPEAKEYWQQKMYTLDQITEMVETDFDDYLDHLLDNNLCSDRTSKNYYSFKQWFNTNKKK